MSPRHNRARRGGGIPRADAADRGDGEQRTRYGGGQVEEWADGEWVVRAVSGAGTAKSYRCPGCDQEIRTPTPHVVAWPADGLGGPDQRRHWHAACWRARGRRGANLQRSRNAPRYG